VRFPVNDVEVAVISIKKRGVIIETPTEARQAERGPSILIASVSLAVLIMGAVWFVFFRTCQVSALLGTARGAIPRSEATGNQGRCYNLLS